jgi:ribonuclease HI
MSSAPVYTIYCDGSCLGNPGPSAWGAVIRAPQAEATEHSGFIGHGTNQVAELTAAIEALKRTPVGVEVHLFSDSEYLVKGLKDWLDGWVRKNWITSTGRPVANVALWRQLLELRRSRKVHPKWVKGHNGDPLNERADALARGALGLEDGHAPRPARAVPGHQARAVEASMSAAQPT